MLLLRLTCASFASHETTNHQTLLVFTICHPSPHFAEAAICSLENFITGFGRVDPMTFRTGRH